MKRAYFISALIVSAVVVGLSESRETTISKEREMSATTVQDGRTSQLEKAKENVKRTWVNVKRKFDGKEQDDSPSELSEGARRGSENGMIQGSEGMSPHSRRVQTPLMPPESEYLKEIAVELSVPVSKDDTPGDIAFKIKQCIGNVERYRGNVLSDESFEKAKSAIRIPSDAETFAEYHRFIKKIGGRNVFILDNGEKRP